MHNATVRRLLTAPAALLLAGALAPAADASASPISRIRVGETEKQVEAILGSNPVLCTAAVSKLCRTPVYLYEYVDGKPLGIGVQFHYAQGAERVAKFFMLKPVNSKSG